MSELVYLNHARTSIPKASPVVDAMRRQLEVLAGADVPAHEGFVDDVAHARESVAGLVGAGDPAHIVFTGSTTEGLNLALKGFLRRGDHVIATAFDHHAVGRTLARLGRERGVTITRVDPAHSGAIEPASVDAAIRADTRLLVVTHASNLTGALCDLEALGAVARARSVAMVVDAAATAGIVPLDVERTGISMLAFGAHKRLLGPAGIGVLYVRPDIELAPLREGNVPGMDDALEQPTVRPAAFESGTPNVLGIVGMGAAARHSMEVGVEHRQSELARLTHALVEGLAEIPRVRTLAPADTSTMVPIVSLRIDRVPPREAAAALRARFGVIASAGLHNCPHLNRTLGTLPEGALRLSPGDPNTASDVARAVAAVRELALG